MTVPKFNLAGFLRGIFQLAVAGLWLCFCSCEQGKVQALQFVVSDSPKTADTQEGTELGDAELGAEPKAPDAAALANTPALPDPSKWGVQGELAELPAAETVRFVAYNLWNYLDRSRDELEVLLKPEAQIQALVEIIVELKPDVLGVNEIGALEDLLDLQKRLREAGIDLPAYAWTTGEDGDRNLGLLSRYPITQASNPMRSYILEHADGNKVNTQLERGILDVSVQLAENYELRTLGVHFKSKREVDYADQSLIRSSEAQLLRDHTESILREEPETNLLVYGDFNDTARSRPVQIVRGKGDRQDPLRLFDLPLEDENGDRWTHYWRWQDLYSRLDYFFYNAALKPEILKDQSGILSGTGYRKASDHRPIYLTIDVPGKDS